VSGAGSTTKIVAAGIIESYVYGRQTAVAIDPSNDGFTAGTDDTGTIVTGYAQVDSTTGDIIVWDLDGNATNLTALAEESVVESTNDNIDAQSQAVDQPTEKPLAGDHIIQPDSQDNWKAFGTSLSITGLPPLGLGPDPFLPSHSPNGPIDTSSLFGISPGQAAATAAASGDPTAVKTFVASILPDVEGGDDSIIPPGSEVTPDDVFNQYLVSPDPLSAFTVTPPPVDERGTPLATDPLTGLGWDPVTGAFDIAAGSILHDDGTVEIAGPPKPGSGLGRVTARSTPDPKSINPQRPFADAVAFGNVAEFLMTLATPVEGEVAAPVSIALKTKAGTEAGEVVAQALAKKFPNQLGLLGARVTVARFSTIARDLVGSTEAIFRDTAASANRFFRDKFIAAGTKPEEIIDVFHSDTIVTEVDGSASAALNALFRSGQETLVRVSSDATGVATGDFWTTLSAITDSTTGELMSAADIQRLLALPASNPLPASVVVGGEIKAGTEVWIGSTGGGAIQFVSPKGGGIVGIPGGPVIKLH